MNLFGMMETSGGAMQAERMRAEVVAANMANAETTHTATGGAYHRQHVVFAANQGDPEFATSMTAATGTRWMKIWECCSFFQLKNRRHFG